MLIDPARTFSTAYASSANSDALRMIKRAAHGARSRNPILIRGPVASGKTQLMHAIANAIRAGHHYSYRQALALSGILLVDALEDLAQCPSTEETLGVAMQSVVASGGLVVLAIGPTSPDHGSRLRAWLSAFLARRSSNGARQISKYGRPH